MNTIISAKNVSKSYGDFHVLDNINVDISPGRIIGLIGPNGAGKTTFLRCLLGLASYNGDLEVLGKSPLKNRVEMLHDVAFIADTAILPGWMSVLQVLEYTSGVHPKFDRKRAMLFLEKTDIILTKKIKTLSKGMITQLHLALVVSIDAKLLVLDEPTLGLDVIYRKQFYEQLLNDYFDEQRTIVITTHQVEEVESLLTDLIFIQKGKIVLDKNMSQVSDDFFELEVHGDQILPARELGPIYERSILGGVVMMFEHGDREKAAEFGRLRNPSVVDLFVAKMSS